MLQMSRYNISFLFHTPEVIIRPLNNTIDIVGECPHKLFPRCFSFKWNPFVNYFSYAFHLSRLCIILFHKMFRLFFPFSSGILYYMNSISKYLGRSVSYCIFLL